jgi:hypothetical protein
MINNIKKGFVPEEGYFDINNLNSSTGVAQSLLKDDGNPIGTISKTPEGVFGVAMWSTSKPTPRLGGVNVIRIANFIVTDRIPSSQLGGSSALSGNILSTNAGF